MILGVETASADTNPSVRATYGFPAVFLGECASLVAAEGSVISFLEYDCPMQHSLLKRRQEHNPVLAFASAAFSDDSLVGGMWKASGLVTCQVTLCQDTAKKHTREPCCVHWMPKWVT